jgi:hypothetical protein
LAAGEHRYRNVAENTIWAHGVNSVALFVSSGPAKNKKYIKDFLAAFE